MQVHVEMCREPCSNGRLALGANEIHVELVWAHSEEYPSRSKWPSHKIIIIIIISIVKTIGKCDFVMNYECI